MQKPLQTKIVTLGDYAVGKSSLIQRFVKNNFTDIRNQTLGAEFSPKQIIRKDKLVELQIWDTAGQEVYRSIAKLYYQDAHFAILVYDVTRPSSFEVLKFWINKLQEEGLTDIVKFIIANKVDLETIVSIDDVKQFASQMQIEVFQTSCKDNIGVFELFNHIADIVVDRENQKQQYNQKQNVTSIKIGPSESQKQNEGNQCC